MGWGGRLGEDCRQAVYGGRELQGAKKKQRAAKQGEKSNTGTERKLLWGLARLKRGVIKQKVKNEKKTGRAAQRIFGKSTGIDSVRESYERENTSLKEEN